MASDELVIKMSRPPWTRILVASSNNRRVSTRRFASAPRTFPSAINRLVSNPHALYSRLPVRKFEKKYKDDRSDSNNVSEERTSERDYRSSKYRRTITAKFLGKLEEPCGNRAKLQGIIPGETPSHLYSQFPVRVYLYVDPSVEFISEKWHWWSFAHRSACARSRGWLGSWFSATYRHANEGRNVSNSSNLLMPKMGKVGVRRRSASSDRQDRSKLCFRNYVFVVRQTPCRWIVQKYRFDMKSRTIRSSLVLSLFPEQKTLN